jgi:hypothetical protein
VFTALLLVMLKLVTPMAVAMLDELLLATVSVMLAGSVNTAVLVTPLMPVAVAATAVTISVTELPVPLLTLTLSVTVLPEPLAVLQEAAPTAVQTQVTVEN